MTGTLTTPLRPTSDQMTHGATRDVALAAELSGVSVMLGGQEVLSDLDLTVHRGEIVALIGASGSGKSTTLRVLAGLTTPDRGDRAVDGPPSVVFQAPRLLPWRSALHNVVRGLDRLDLPRTEAKARAADILAEVGLAGREDAWPAQLSGGQAQRVALARGLVGEPRVMLLDEPFSALDALTRRTMHELLLGLWARHDFGVLFVTHDVDEAITLADRVLVLDAGRVAHEERIAAPREGLAADDRDRHRQALLAELGVEG